MSAAVDFDYRDFLSCDDLTTNLTGTNLFVSFPDEPYSDSNGDPITLTDGKYYIDRDIILENSNTNSLPDNLIIEGCQIVVLSHNPPWKIIVEPSAKLNIVPLFFGVWKSK
ncbi:MAG: hypothetical protein IPP71_05715 [Bacteroidetes bacterium]|nr:hypothetical protein [Bacteroidota bacterium]